MANPLDVVECKLKKVNQKLNRIEIELDRRISEMQSLMAAFDCDPVLDVEVFTFTDAVNAKREAAGFSPADRVTYALTNSIEHALRVTGDYHE